MFAKKYVTRMTLVGSLVAASFAGTLHAQDFRFAVGFAPGSASTDGAEAFGEVLEQESDGTLSARIFALDLLGLGEMSGGVRDGIADVGNVLAPYFPSQFPHTNMVAELTMLLTLSDPPDGRHGMAYMGAVAEFMMLNCADCLDEWAAQQQVYLPNGATPEYQLMCTEPVRDQSELQGKRLRVAGAQWARWAEHFEASTVSLPGGEVFEALSQGVVDCTVQSSPELGNFQLKEVVTDITTDVPGGVFSGGALSFNRSVWQGLDDKQREHVLRAAARLAGEVTWRYQAYGERDLEEAREAGVTVHDPSAELVEASRQFIEADVARIAASYEDNYDIADAEAKIAELRPMIEDWMKRLEDTDVEDGEDLGDLYWEAIYSRVDPASYGL